MNSSMLRRRYLLFVSKNKYCVRHESRIREKKLLEKVNTLCFGLKSIQKKDQRFCLNNDPGLVSV